MRNGALALCSLVPVAIVIGCVVVSEKPADSAPPPAPPATAAPVPAAAADPPPVADAAPAPTPTATTPARPQLRSRRSTGADAGATSDAGLLDAAGD